MFRTSRRRLLSTLGSVSLLGSTSVSGDLVSIDTDGTASRTLEDLFSRSTPPNPDEPFLVTDYAGYGSLGTEIEPDAWPDADRRTARDEILRLDPDVPFSTSFGWGVPPLESGITNIDRVVGIFNKTYGLPVASGESFYMMPWENQDWYEGLPEDEKWTHPDGSTVEHLEELAGADFDGTRWVDDSNRSVPSLFADGTKEFFARNMAQNFDLGATRFWFDHLAILLSGPLDFSHWARAAWEDHLYGLSTDRLRELGIEDPTEFDLRRHLSDRGLTPGETEFPIVDPVFREYARFQHRAYRDFTRDLFSEARSDLPRDVEDAGTAIFGNQFGLQPHVLRAPAFYLSDVVDEIQIEIGGPTLPPILPPREHPMAIKTGRAAGRFEKPVTVYSTFGGYDHEDPAQYGLDSTEYYPTMMQLEAAQAYAHGALATGRFTHRGRFEHMLNGWMRPDGSVGGSLHQFADFVRAHERFLTDVTEANDAVVALSLPTILWLWSSGAGPGRDQTQGVPGTGAALRREHVPYDVRILDYPPVWEAPEQTAGLAEFDVLVLPNVVCVSDDHVTAIEAAIDRGTTVIAVGGAPTRTAEFEPREDVAELLDTADNATVVDGYPAHDGLGDAATALRTAVPDDARRVEVDTNGDVSLNAFEQHDPDRFLVHMVNFDYDPETDSTTERSGFDLTVRDLPVDPGVAKYYSPQVVESLEVEERGGTVTITVPSLDVWGFVVFGESEDALAPDTGESAAVAAIDEARQAVNEAEENGQETLLERATTKLSAAKSALEYDSYAVGADLGTEAKTWAERSYEPPVVGIDQAHGQSRHDVTSWEGLDGTRAALSEFQFVKVTDWNEETLEDLDVLFVPPDFGPETYAFSEEDVRAVQAFVESGGGLVVDVRVPDSGINDLATAFGFEFDAAEVGSPEGNRVDVEIEHSSLTWMFDGATQPDSVISDASDAYVWARVSDDSEAWLNRSGEVSDRGPDDEDAGGSPVGVATAFGDGLVVGSCFNTVSNIQEGNNQWLLARNQLELLGRNARSTRPRTVAVDDGDSDVNDGDPDEENADDRESDPENGSENGSSEEGSSATETEGTPGLGLSTAVASVGGLAYLLKRRVGSDDES